MPFYLFENVVLSCKNRHWFQAILQSQKIERRVFFSEAGQMNNEHTWLHTKWHFAFQSTCSSVLSLAAEQSCNVWLQSAGAGPKRPHISQLGNKKLGTSAPVQAHLAAQISLSYSQYLAPVQAHKYCELGRYIWSSMLAQTAKYCEFLYIWAACCSSYPCCPLWWVDCQVEGKPSRADGPEVNLWWSCIVIHHYPDYAPLCTRAEFQYVQAATL